MFRNALFSALVVMMASSAFAATRDANRDVRDTKAAPHAAETATSKTTSEVAGSRSMETFVESNARISPAHAEAASRIQEMARNPSDFGLENSPGFAEFVKNLDGKSVDQALKDQNTSKEELMELCVPKGKKL